MQKNDDLNFTLEMSKKFAKEVVRNGLQIAFEYTKTEEFKKMVADSIKASDLDFRAALLSTTFAIIDITLNNFMEDMAAGIILKSEQQSGDKVLIH